MKRSGIQSPFRYTRCNRNGGHAYQPLQLYCSRKIWALSHSIAGAFLWAVRLIDTQLVLGGTLTEGKCQALRLLMRPRGLPADNPKPDPSRPKSWAFHRNVTIHIHFSCALDVETTSVHLIAMQKLTAAPMITRVQGGGTCRRKILWSMHQNCQKSNSSSAPYCSARGIAL